MMNELSRDRKYDAIVKRFKKRIKDRLNLLNLIEKEKKRKQTTTFHEEV